MPPGNVSDPICQSLVAPKFAVISQVIKVIAIIS